MHNILENFKDKYYNVLINMLYIINNLYIMGKKLNYPLVITMFCDYFYKIVETSIYFYYLSNNLNWFGLFVTTFTLGLFWHSISKRIFLLLHT